MNIKKITFHFSRETNQLTSLMYWFQTSVNVVFKKKNYSYKAINLRQKLTYSKPDCWYIINLIMKRNIFCQDDKVFFLLLQNHRLFLSHIKCVIHATTSIENELIFLCSLLFNLIPHVYKCMFFLVLFNLLLNGYDFICDHINAFFNW